MKKRYLLLVIAIIYISGNFILARWENTLYYGDSNGYYLHLVSFFINNDVGDYDKTITTLRIKNPGSADPREDKYGIRLTEKGRRYIKYTLGVPLMETPFFLMAHAYAKASPKYEADGWSKPYLFSIGLAIIFYILIGFYLLIKVLERYFSSKITALVVITIAIATNLFYQATYVTMSHGFLFFDYCLLMFLTDRFYDQPNWKKALGVGAMVGLISLTRIPEIISVFIPILWGISNWNTLKERILYFLKNYRLLIAATVGFFLFFSIQMAYWHYVSDQLFFDPYKGEGFNFLKPNIHKGWFHFANGWLIYTPVMGFSLIGWYILRKQLPGFRAAMFVFVGLQAWIHYSYYAWTFFPGFGQRPMVETYPILAFGLGAFFTYSFKRQWLRYVILSAVILFTTLNLFQTWQMKEGIIWTERGNMAFYWATFGTLTPTRNSLRSYDSKKVQPDSSDIVFIKNLVTEGFEDNNPVSKPYYNGKHALLSQGDTTYLVTNVPLQDVQPKDWLRLSVYGYRKGSEKPASRDACEILAFEIMDQEGKKQAGAEIKPSTHIGNPTHSIWTSGGTNQWGEISIYLRVPSSVNDGWKFKAYIYNPHGQKLYLDDFRVAIYRKK